MTERPPRYRDYLATPAGGPVAPGPDPGFRDSVVVMRLRDGSWHAVWQGRSSVLAEFDGSEQDAVDWARRRSPRCWVYSVALDDVVPLEPEDPA